MMPAPSLSSADRVPLARACALLCALLGMMVLGGWWGRIPELVRMVPGHAAMAPNTALTLVLLGLALALPPGSRRAGMARLAAGLFTAVLAAVTLAAGGIDHLLTAPWLADGAYSGRMSRTTALAVLFAGLSTVLVNDLRSARRIALCQACLLILSLVAASVLAGYASDVELLYNWFYEKPVAPHSLAGLLLLSASLWPYWHAAARRDGSFVGDAHRRIVLVGSNLFVGGIMVAGLSAFVVQAKDAERALRQALENALEYQEAAVDRILREEEAQLDALFITRPGLAALAETSLRAPADARASLALREALETLGRVDGLSVTLHPSGTRPDTGGPRFQAPLGEDAWLMWDDGPFLRKRIPLRSGTRIIGHAVVDDPLPRLREVFARAHQLGSTAESGMCYLAAPQRMRCIPTRFHPQVFDAPLESGKLPLPMTYALRGATGTVLTTDYRGQRVIAAHRPLADYPLAMVSKVDSAELYAPVRPRLLQQLLLMAALVGGGLLALRRLLTPVILKLIDSEERFRSYVETTDDWVWAADAQGRIGYSNPRAEQALGYGASELEGRRLSDLLHPADRALLEQALAAGEGWKQLQLRCMRRDGSWRHFHSSAAPARNAAGAISGYRGVNHDISELKQAEDELFRRQSFLDSIVENMPTMVFVKEAASLRYLVLNRAGEALLGCTRGEVLGKTDHEVFGPAQADIHVTSDRHALAAGGLVDIGEEVITAPGGQQRIVHTRKIAIPDKHGRPAFVLGISDDITERKRAENIKNEFISVVSHELRTPLTSILGALEILEIGAAGPLPDKAGKFVRIAGDNSKRLLRLINDMLDIDKIESGVFRLEMRNVDLAEIVRAAVEANAEYAARLGVRFEFAAHAVQSPLMVRGDPDRLMQVMANLLSNAAKFSPEGGRVEVSLEPLHGNARVSVGNGGPGVPEAFRKSIFNKFSQADSSSTRNRQGSGLGLAVVKSLIDKMGGSVGFVSEPDVWTVFYFELPLRD